MADKTNRTSENPLPPKLGRSLLGEPSVYYKLGYHAFPFKTKLSFVPLINQWKKKVSGGDQGEAILAKEIIRRLDQALEFLAPIEDYERLKKHRNFVELMLVGVFPSIQRASQLAVASKPFEPKGFYFTPRLRRLLSKDDITFHLNRDAESVRVSTIIRSCCMILNECYGQNLKLDEPVIFTITDEEGNIERQYKSELDVRFVEIKKLKALRAISQEDVNYLMRNIDDVDLWLQYIPPSHFEFHGMVSLNLVDVTEEESLSRLKKILLDRDAVVAAESITRLRQQLRNFYNLPDLELGLSAIDFPVDDPVPHKYKIKHSFLSKKIKKLFAPKYQGSIYEKVCVERQVMVVEDLHKIATNTGLEKHLKKAGFRSVIIVPLLRKDNKVVGLLELGSKRAYALNSFSALKLREITPLFRTAVRRSRQEIDNEIEAIIRDQYTALHPSVEWKFIESAFRLLEQRERQGEHVEVEPIIFKDVFPLYGQADIIGSTNIRNAAIQADFLENLRQIQQILLLSKAQMSAPLADNYLLDLQEEINRLESTVSSDDEFRTLDFIKREIHPLFGQMDRTNVEVKEALEYYFAGLDPVHQTIYRKRKAYEESVVKINKAIADFLEEEEKRTQQILPHYFEQKKTDGVEYEIYVGQSLLRQGLFGDVHLSNLRLWQLIAMCEITRNMELLKKDLPMPLETAQLILVHNTSLSIRFRLDEKHFDVDGMYDIRYAILKKRIDKALVEGSSERLTQAGKIAIVYTNDKDRTEYRKYLKYLIKKDYINEEIEDLKLGRMQGVYGLRALRVSVLAKTK